MRNLVVRVVLLEPEVTLDVLKGGAVDGDLVDASHVLREVFVGLRGGHIEREIRLGGSLGAPLLSILDDGGVGEHGAVFFRRLVAGQI